MSENHQDNCCIAPIPLANFDYQADEFSIIKIHTKDRLPYFGKMVDDTMALSFAGLIALDLWHLIPTQFPFITLDNFVVMPDYIIGILRPNVHSGEYTRFFIPPKIDLGNPLDTKMNGICEYKNAMPVESISKVIRWFKGACKYEIKKSIPEFEWQTGAW